MDVCLYPPDSMTGFVWNQNGIVYRIAIVSRDKPQRITPIQLEILLCTSVQKGYGLQTMIVKDEIIDFYYMCSLNEMSVLRPSHCCMNHLQISTVQTMIVKDEIVGFLLLCSLNGM